MSLILLYLKVTIHIKLPQALSLIDSLDKLSLCGTHDIFHLLLDRPCTSSSVTFALFDTQNR